MKPINAYKFCPRCAETLEKKKENMLLCPNCGFEFYINALLCNAVVIENDKGEILLVKRKYDPMKGFWDWPGGFIDGGESLEHSVKREIKEELGIEVKILKIIGVYEDIYLFQGLKYPSLCIAVSAKITDGVLKAADDIEGFKFFSKNDVLNQDFAFPSIKNGLKDYLDLTK